MKRLFKKFTADECGAVTVDWVVLTAALVGFGGLIVGQVREGAVDLGEATGDHISSMVTE